MKQKFSTIFILLLLFFAGSRVVAQNAPKPFDIEQPSLRVFLPAPDWLQGVLWLRVREVDIHIWHSNTKAVIGRPISINKVLH